MNYRLAARTNAARVLTVAGVILILSFLVDFFFLLFPFQPTSLLWQVDLVTALVDRGIVPFVGLGMLFAGYWFDTIEDVSHPAVDLRFPALILSSLLGLMFLLIFPVHLNNVRQVSAQTVEQINRKAEQEENQVQAQLSNEQVKNALEKQKSQAKARYAELLKDDEQYQQLLNDPNVPQVGKDLLTKFKANPQELDQFIEKQSDPQTLADQQLSRIRQDKEEAEKLSTDRVWMSGLRIAINSSLLSIGYFIVAWTVWSKSRAADTSQQTTTESLVTKA
ncbi:MAG: HpsJ family protein [Rhizonema sp. PD38]|nr:HpsJ family protein [Rhizonema sp. PD38]